MFENVVLSLVNVWTCFEKISYKITGTQSVSAKLSKCLTKQTFTKLSTKISYKITGTPSVITAVKWHKKPGEKKIIYIFDCTFCG